MSWLRRSHHTVPGVPSVKSSGGWDAFRATDLADQAVVAEALARAPKTFADLVFEPGSPELALSHRQLLADIGIATRDGSHWSLGVGDESKAVIDTGPDVFDDDLVVEALTAQPGVVGVSHPDREEYEIRVAEPVRADQALALFLDAISQAHRELARRLRVDIAE
ncbi:hypothetical protein [Actinoplanes sp. GCM10030250]|uniref:hypothetical protein n=1 Tax=Actinoplanes sp. GCM10030250 TaxID=3273376 RepID=UPI003618C404